MAKCRATSGEMHICEYTD